jgi:TRAP-type C4-dicarboxylate transport system permease small subunit
MSLKAVTNVFERGLSPLITIIGYIGSAMIALMMLLTVSDVIARGFFDQSVQGAYELSEFMLVIVVFFSMAGCQLLKGHITIDLIFSRFPQRTRNIIDSIMYFFFLIMFCILTWRLIDYAIRETGGTISGMLGIPVFPFIYMAALGSALFSLVVLMHLLVFITGALKK